MTKNRSNYQGSICNTRSLLWAVSDVIMALLLAVSAVETFAQDAKDNGSKIVGPKLIEFDPPGTATRSSSACAPFCGTFAYANNDLGDIVGTYTDVHVVPHGFLRTAQGSFISFDAPGAGLGFGLDEGTVAYSINNQGVITGQFEDPNLVFHGFVRYADGTFATFDAPGAGTGAFQGTFGNSISQEGVISGNYTDANYVYHGFVRDQEGNITTFDAPGAGMNANASPQGTYPCLETCTNSAGAITGFLYDAGYALHGFVRQPDGEITTVDAPRAATGAFLGTVSGSINTEGTLAGYLVDSNNAYHGFVSTPNGDFVTFDVPLSSQTPGQGTVVYSINATGTTTGQYNDTDGANIGFSRTAAGSFTTFSAPGAGSSPSQGTRPSANNAQGAVTGWWIDQNNLNHGFVWTPAP